MIRKFNILRISVLLAIIGIVGAVTTPIYVRYHYRQNVSEIVNYFAKIKLDAFDHYLANKNWPDKIDQMEVNKILPSSISYFVNNSYYEFKANQAWFGYQLSNDYGGGWIFMLLIANQAGDFRSYCGSFESGCEHFGSCASFKYFPLGCTDQDLNVYIYN